VNKEPGEGGYTVHAANCTCHACTYEGRRQALERRVKLLETKIVEMGEAWSKYVREMDERLRKMRKSCG